MSISMHQLSAPLLLRSLDNLTGILEKAKAFCAEKEVEESVLLSDRLFCNMFPLAMQFQVAADQARSTMANLAGTTPLLIEGDETSFDGLLARVAKSKAYVAEFTEAQLDGSDNKPVSFAIGPYQLDFDNGFQYLQAYALPNFQFHVTTAYNILRHNGVELGKGDFLGNYGGQLSMPGA